MVIAAAQREREDPGAAPSSLADLDDGSFAEPRSDGIPDPHDVSARDQRLFGRTAQLGKQIRSGVAGGFEDSRHVEHLPAPALGAALQRPHADDHRTAEPASALRAVFELDLEILGDGVNGRGKRFCVADFQRRFERGDVSRKVVAVVVGRVGRPLLRTAPGASTARWSRAAGPSAPAPTPEARAPGPRRASSGWL